jgi:hypothetical protein
MTPDEVRKIVAEALGAERASLFEQLVASHQIEPGFAYNAILVQLYGLRLSDEMRERAEKDGRLVLALTAIAKVADQINLQTRGLAGQIDNVEKSAREHADSTRQLTSRFSTPVKQKRTAPKPLLFVTGSAIIGALLCASFWNVGYQRGANERAYTDALAARKNPAAWSRFVRNEVGK